MKKDDFTSAKSKVKGTNKDIKMNFPCTKIGVGKVSNTSGIRLDMWFLVNFTKMYRRERITSMFFCDVFYEFDTVYNNRNFYKRLLERL